MPRGKVRLSLDFECAWGLVSEGRWRANEAAGVYRNLRPALRRFVDRLDELEMSFTWAVVGAMIEPPRERDLSHLKGAFAQDVATFLAEAEDETTDGRDLLELVLAMRTKQTFGTHTYSHLLFSDPEQDARVIAEDLARAASANARYGLDFTRVVFPRNHSGHYAAVHDAGIKVARMHPRNTPDPTARPGRLSRGISAFLRKTSPVIVEQAAEGLILHYASEYLNWGAGANLAKRTAIRVRVARALQQAELGADVHFWFHPFNLSEIAGLHDEIDGFLLKVVRLRDKGLVEVAGF